MNPPRSYNGGVLFLIRLPQFNQTFVSQRFTLTQRTTQSGKISSFTFCSMFSLFFLSYVIHLVVVLSTSLEFRKKVLDSQHYGDQHEQGVEVVRWDGPGFIVLV